MSTTQAELDGMLGRTARAAREAGVDTAGWTLHGGSKVNGIQFNLTVGIGVVKLGLTRTEAWQTLHAMEQAFEIAARAGRQS